MPSCEIIGYRFAVRIDYRIEQDVAANQSVVHVTGAAIRSMWDCDGGSAWVIGSIRVNNLPAAAMTLSSTEGCGVALSMDYYTGGEGIWSGFRSEDVVVEHGDDGSAAVEFHADLQIYLKNETPLPPGINAAVSAELPTIPRASQIMAEGVTLGQEMTIRLERAAERFRDSVDWRCGNVFGILVNKTTAGEVRWTPKLELAAQTPDAAAVPVTVRVRTYDGVTQVGSRELTVLCPIPESVVPTLSVSVTDPMGCTENHGGFLRTRSRARVCTTAEGAYGSEVTEIDVTCGGLSAAGADVVFALEDSGNVPICVTVTDSRGRTAAYSTSIAVLPYEKPWAVIRQAYRCDSAGSSQPDGGYLKLIFDGGATPVQGGTVEYRAEQTVHGGTEQRQTLLTDYTNVFSVTGGSVVLPAGVDNGYDCRIAVTDSFQTGSSIVEPVSVAFVLLDMSRGTRAVGLGMRARTAGVLSIGMDADMVEHRICNLAPPESHRDAATREYVDSQIQLLAQTLGVTL